MNFKEKMHEVTSYVIDIRREFHQYPELSMEERETTKRIAAKLEELGIPYEINEKNRTGLVGVIKGGNPGKAVALRADIDALPVTEDTGLPFTSKNAGVMHACGHDNHIAMLLGAAKLLRSVQEEICGTVYLVFQPAEEIGTGAPYMMEFGDWFSKCGAIFGAHIWGTLPAGKVGTRTGETMAATEKFVIRISGKQSHGSQPQLGIDAVYIAAATVMNLQAVMSRQMSPFDSVVFTVGVIKAGDRWNIVGGEAVIEGTVRHFNNELSRKIKASMERIAQHTAEAYGATASLTYEQLVPPTINDAACTECVEKAVKEVLGEEAFFGCEKNMGSEDFAYYEQEKCGCYFFIGTYNEEKGTVYSNHSNHFTSDEDVLTGGAAVYAQAAVSWLEGNK